MTSKSIEVEWTPGSTTDKVLLGIHAYWLSLRRAGSTPYRGDFKPSALPGLLPSAFLVDVLDDPRDFRFRLVGTAFRQVAGHEFTGRLLKEVFPPSFAHEVFEGWNAVVEKGGPIGAAAKCGSRKRTS